MFVDLSVLLHCIVLAIMADEPSRQRNANADDESFDAASLDQDGDPFINNEHWIRAQFELVHREIVSVKSENAWLWEILKGMRSNQEFVARIFAEQIATLVQNMNTRVQEMTEDLQKLQRDITVIQNENAVLQWQIKKLEDKANNVQ